MLVQLAEPAPPAVLHALRRLSARRACLTISCMLVCAGLAALMVHSVPMGNV